MLRIVCTHGIWLNFWSNITGNLNEAEVEAKASTMHR